MALDIANAGREIYLIGDSARQGLLKDPGLIQSGLVLDQPQPGQRLLELVAGELQLPALGLDVALGQ